ncbi:DnaJ-domain-containing protein [Amniculicola lignicola CBS 123094]|uniref:DnaJ-domain-containing protein n=1 Tax=Amniculicola lignicola CBS 123094 TaxID=1392246 RepID=A0A6A5WQG8_9PLEO|nr:DnaJ-domain-containing protein [Amniculicola lignicola CBS 123094]
MTDNTKDLEEIAKTTTDDFYLLLGVEFEATASQIKSAYRKTSIKYHPDRNPDAGAADKFILLAIARDILLDPTLKHEYDKQRLRKKEKRLQDDMLDSKRRKMKEDLESREKGAKRKWAEELSEAERREQEIQRLAEDGKRRRKEQQEKLERERREEEASFMETTPEAEVPTAKPGESAEIDRTIKVRFQREGGTLAWDKETVTAMFSKYGKVDGVVMGRDKKVRLSGEKHRKVTATVFVVYTRLDHAHAAVSDAKADYPLLESAAWAGKEPDMNFKASFRNGASGTGGDYSAPSTPDMSKKKTFRASFTGGLGKGFGSAPGTPSFSFSPSTPSLEEVTMMRLKQAEKKRLEEQIRKQEAAEEAAA